MCLVISRGESGVAVQLITLIYFRVIKMWFKNLKIFQFTEQFDVTWVELEEKLEALPFRPCGNIELSTQGWFPPAGRDANPLIVKGAGGNFLVCLRKEEKLLPSSVINEVLADKVQQARENEGRAVGRKEQRQFKEEIIQALLPQAFVHSKFTFGYIDISNQRLIINSASDSAADLFCSHLRKTLGSLPLKPLSVPARPPTLMTDWLLNDSNPADIELLDQSELRDPWDGGSVVRCRRQDLRSKEMIEHVRAGKEAYRLAINWNNRIELVIDEDLCLRQLRFSELVLDEREPCDDPISQVSDDFRLMSLEINLLVNRMIEIFG